MAENLSNVLLSDLRRASSQRGHAQPGIIGRRAARAATEKVRDTMISDKTFLLWPIMPFGGEEDPDSTGDENDKDGNEKTLGNTKSSNKSDSGNTKKGESDDKTDDDDEYAGFSLAELKRIAADNAQKASEKEVERKKAQDIIDAAERKKNDDITNLTKDLEKERENTAALRATVAKQAIESAIRDDDRWSWHDIEMVASTALQLNSEISVDNDGKVSGLSATLPKVAKQHPFLVKETKGSKNNSKDNNQNGNGPTGFQPGQGGTSNGGGSEVDTKKLAENYPALASRI